MSYKRFDMFSGGNKYNRAEDFNASLNFKVDLN